MYNSTDGLAIGYVPHYRNYVVNFLCQLYYQTQLLDFPAMLSAGAHNIDPCGVNATVPQDVRQFGDVLFNTIEGPGEQLAQIVGKHLAGLHTRCFAELFHIRPDVAPVQGLSVTGDKDGTGGCV